MSGLVGNGKKIMAPTRSERCDQKEYLIKQINEETLKLKKEEGILPSYSSNNQNCNKKGKQTVEKTAHETRVEDLMEKLVPMRDVALPPEDTDCLRPHNKKTTTKRLPVAAYDSSCSTTMITTCWPPRAQYLRHVDTYALALPYVIPF